MLERLCKELGLKFNGRWDEAGLYMFTITNPKLLSVGTTFSTHDTDRVSLLNHMNESERAWEQTKNNYIKKNKEDKTMRKDFIVFEDELQLKQEKENIIICVEAGFITKEQADNILSRLCLRKEV